MDALMWAAYLLFVGLACALACVISLYFLFLAPGIALIAYGYHMGGSIGGVLLLLGLGISIIASFPLWAYVSEFIAERF